MTLGQQSPGKDLRVRYLYLGLAMMVGLMALTVRLYRLQVTRGDEFAQKSVANFVKEVRIPADRGMIVDKNGVILVDSRPSFNVFITPAFCEDCVNTVLPQLSGWLNWDSAALAKAEGLVREARRTAPFRPVPVAIDLTRDEVDTLHAHLRELHGVDLEAVPHRNYRLGTVMGHVLGYMNEIGSRELEKARAEGKDYALGDYLGRKGIERAYEHVLRGRDGIRREVVDARGRTLPNLNDLLEEEKETPPNPGNNVVLTIDERLQEEAERVFPGQAGVVIALDVRTGYILAMVSKPSFDPNLLTGRITPKQLQELQKDPLEPMINRTVGEHYSPGSVFKVVTALAALRSGQFNTETKINCPGGYRLGRRTWRCHKDSGHGPKDVRGALQTSCDTYFYRVADLLGLDAIAEVGESLGLGHKTGLGVFPEVPGIMPSVAYHDRANRKTGGYTKGMALNAAIGQGDDNTTPLQIVQLYAAIANGGKVYRPQLVQRVVGPDGQIVSESKPELVRDIHIAPEHHKVIVEALSAVVNEAGGTAYSKRLKDIKVAGKTGTAQVARLGAKRLKTHEMSYFQRDHAWFAAFAPVESPEIAIVVLNEHGGHGGSDAAPTAMAVFQKYFDLKRQDAEAAHARKLGLPPPPIPDPAPAPRTPAPVAVRAPAPAAAPAAATSRPPPAPDAGAQTAAPTPASGAAASDPVEGVGGEVGAQVAEIPAPPEGEGTNPTQPPSADGVRPAAAAPGADSAQVQPAVGDNGTGAAPPNARTAGPDRTPVTPPPSSPPAPAPAAPAPAGGAVDGGVTRAQKPVRLVEPLVAKKPAANAKSRTTAMVTRTRAPSVKASPQKAKAKPAQASAKKARSR